MESGSSNSARRCGVLLFLFLAFFSMVGGCFGQQPVSGNQTPPSAVSAEPAVQPFPDAATPVANPAAQASPGAIPKDTSDSALVKLGPGDLMEFAVYNVPELATKARVSNSGDIYLPLINYVHVGGLTQEEAQTVIEKRLEDGGFLRNPHVTIFVDEATSQGVTVLGEVARAGIYPDPPDRKLYQVISEAGGFTNSASRKIAIVRHNQTDPIRIDLPRNLADDMSGNVDVLPGDTIMVPRAPVIYVVGDVGRPAGFLVDNGTLTVLQALALAGGANRTAKTNGVRLIRKTPTGMTETKVQLKKMLEAKTPDITLQADDILFVPISGGKLAAARTLDAGLAMASAVGIYSIRP